MSPLARTVAYGLAFSRIGIGTVAVLMPGLAMKFWLGVESEPKAIKAMGIAIGARDLALGIGTMAALRGNTGSSVWLQCGALADTADSVGTIRAFSADSRNPRMLIAVAGAGAAAAGLWVSQQATKSP